MTNKKREAEPRDFGPGKLHVQAGSSLLGFCLLCLLLASAFCTRALSQEHRLVDFIELKLTTAGVDSLLTFKFQEVWVIDPSKPSVSKQVMEADSSLSLLWESLPEGSRSAPEREISYEFHFLDPHLLVSGNRAFAEPGSMDGPTRKLQGELAALVDAQSDAGSRYRLSDQMLSVIFHEVWSPDPSLRAISKKVRAVTPVIWQRRQTVNGEPINEAGTGLPVYFRTELQQIPLRNP